MFSPLSDLQAAQWLLAELHDDLPGRVARFQQINDLCANPLSHYRSVDDPETSPGERLRTERLHNLTLLGDATLQLQLRLICLHHQISDLTNKQKN